MKTIPTIVSTAIDAIYEIKLAKKKDLSNKCLIKVVHPNRNIDGPYKGLITEDMRFMHCDQLGRSQIHPLVFNENGKKVIYLPQDSHNIDFNKIMGIAMAQRYDALVAWQYMRNWVSTRIQCKGSIDWNLCDNKISPDFSADTYLVTQTTALKVLKEIPNIKVLLMCLATGLIFFIVATFIWVSLFLIYLLLKGG